MRIKKNQTLFSASLVYRIHCTKYWPVTRTRFRDGQKGFYRWGNMYMVKEIEKEDTYIGEY